MSHRSSTAWQISDIGVDSLPSIAASGVDDELVDDMVSETFKWRGGNYEIYMVPSGVYIIMVRVLLYPYIVYIKIYIYVYVIRITVSLSDTTV